MKLGNIHLTQTSDFKERLLRGAAIRATSPANDLARAVARQPLDDPHALRPFEDRSSRERK